jgi:acetyl-CoA C-acetyltransferase
MTGIAILAATRTAIGTFQGSLSGVPAPNMGAHLMRSVLERTGIEPTQVDEIILGQVLTAGSGQNVARQAGILGGLSPEVPAVTVNKVCGAGMKAVHFAAQAIRAGDADLIFAGGQENMSLAPYVLPKARTGLRMGHATLEDSVVRDGLWDAFYEYLMGVTAENIVERYGLTRAEQDAFAVASQRKAKQRMPSLPGVSRAR